MVARLDLPPLRAGPTGCSLVPGKPVLTLVKRCCMPSGLTRPKAGW